jgi:hypothetical protein
MGFFIPERFVMAKNAIPNAAKEKDSSANAQTDVGKLEV